MYDDEVLRDEYEEAASAGPGKMALPITLTLVGLGAISIAFLLASRPDVRTAATLDYEEDGYDVENFDVVKDKPFIYSICE
jgi:hypothetical protein